MRQEPELAPEAGQRLPRRRVGAAAVGDQREQYAWIGGLPVPGCRLQAGLVGVPVGLRARRDASCPGRRRRVGTASSRRPADPRRPGSRPRLIHAAWLVERRPVERVRRVRLVAELREHDRQVRADVPGNDREVVEQRRQITERFEIVMSPARGRRLRRDGLGVRVVPPADGLDRSVLGELRAAVRADAGSPCTGRWLR